MKHFKHRIEKVGQSNLEKYRHMMNASIYCGTILLMFLIPLYDTYPLEQDDTLKELTLNDVNKYSRNDNSR